MAWFGIGVSGMTSTQALETESEFAFESEKESE